MISWAVAFRSSIVGGDKRPVGGVSRKAVLGNAVKLSEQFLEQAMPRAGQRQAHRLSPRVLNTSDWGSRHRPPHTNPQTHCELFSCFNT